MTAPLPSITSTAAYQTISSCIAPAQVHFGFSETTMAIFNQYTGKDAPAMESVDMIWLHQSIVYLPLTTNTVGNRTTLCCIGAEQVRSGFFRMMGVSSRRFTGTVISERGLADLT